MDAYKFLSDVKPDWSFWFTDGSIARNIYELVNTIEVLELGDFVYHVNEDHQKNDFAKWIGEVLGDGDLAGSLWNEMDQKKYVKKIRKRIKQMEKQQDKQTQQTLLQ
ncbi:MAG: hypothetical protein ABH828_05745 [archaeon]